MAAYTIGLTPLLDDLQRFGNGTKHVAFADNLTGAGKLIQIKSWWDLLQTMGPKYGYYPKPSKSFIIVKHQYEQNARETFSDTNINVTVSGAKHLGAVIGDLSFKEDYIKEKVESWRQQLELLSQIAELQPQAAYSAYINGFKHKFTYFLITISNFESYMQPIEEVIRLKFIPAITGGYICSDNDRNGLSFLKYNETQNIEYRNSRKITKELTENIILQNKQFQINNEEIKKTKKKIKTDKQTNYQNKLEELASNMNEQCKRNIEIIRETGSSNWLSVVPIKEYTYTLNKQQFWDSLRLRYHWPIPGLPTMCPCGEKFNVQHALSCKKGGFITLRHNEVRDITATLLSEVCKDVEVQPSLIKLQGEEQRLINTAKTQDDVRLDFCGRGIWIRGQRAFFDVRVFNPNAQRYLRQTLKQSFAVNEREKKHHCNRRIMEVDQGSFTPLVFTLNGGMAGECKVFYSRLAMLLSSGVEKPQVTTWIRTKINFTLLRSMILCLHGSRTTSSGIKKALTLN